MIGHFSIDETSPQTPKHDCTIIIATLGRKDRRESLERAINSIRAGNKARTRTLLVLNGNKFDQHLVDSLRDRCDLEVIQIAEGSLSAAILEGRRQVQSPFFGFLDDDDEYLPGAIDFRIALMAQHPEASIVATNGYRCVDGENQPMMTIHRNGFITNPQRAILEENWLASCGGIYRTKDLPASLFEGVARYLEWTWLGYTLASSGRKVFLSTEPTFLINDTVYSESKSEAYFTKIAEMLEQMKAIPTDPKTHKLLLIKLAQAWHDTSEFHRKNGNKSASWFAHLRSLTYPTGLRYLAYTRRILF